MTAAKAKSKKPAKIEEVAPVIAAEATLKAFKGFDANWKCRDFQYEVGKSYEISGNIALCSRGFHVVEVPLDAFSYYAPCTSKFADVTLSGVSDAKESDSKRVGSKISVDAALSLSGLIKAHVKVVLERGAKNTATGDYGHAAATGNSGHAAATGYSGHAAATGNSGHAAATGYYGHAAATGYYGHAAATGDYGHAAATGNSGHAAATGDYGHAAATGDYGHAAATGNSGHAAATGYYGHAAATGYYGHAAATGDSGHAATKNGVAVALGTGGRAKAGENGAIVLNRWDETRERFIPAVALVGENGIKPDTLYKLNERGEFVEDANG
jgi:hypothetical protein